MRIVAGTLRVPFAANTDTKCASNRLVVRTTDRSFRMTAAKPCQHVAAGVSPQNRGNQTTKSREVATADERECKLLSPLRG